MTFTPEGEWKLEIGFMTLEQSQHYVANHLQDWKRKGITYIAQVKRDANTLPGKPIVAFFPGGREEMDQEYWRSLTDEQRYLLNQACENLLNTYGRFTTTPKELHDSTRTTP